MTRQSYFRRRFLQFIVLALAGVGLIACPPQDPNVNPNDYPDVLSDEQASKADAEPTQPVSVEEIVLPTGESMSDYLDYLKDLDGDVGRSGRAPSGIGPQLQRKIVLTAMQAKALALENRSLWQYSSDGPDAPAQNGLAYLWGSKNPNVRSAPTPYPNGCTERLYGLDCSGFLYQCATAAGLSIPQGPASLQGTPGAWNNVIPQDWNLEMQVVQGDGPQTGDIIGWGSHIGFLAETAGGSLLVHQSNGHPSNNCAGNYGLNRGPRTLSLQGAVNAFGSNYQLLRLVASISGKWDMFLRCQGASTDAATVEFTINKEGGPFETSGNGIDYDGSPFTMNIQGNYSRETNMLEASINYSFQSGGEARTDKFSIALDFDDTGYFALDKVVDNGGCLAEGRLVNQSTTKGYP